MGLLIRSRNSLPALKNGTDFCATSTVSPVRGIAAGAGVALLDRERAKTAQLHPLAPGQRIGHFIEQSGDDPFDIRQWSDADYLPPTRQSVPNVSSDLSQPPNDARTRRLGQ